MQGNKKSKSSLQKSYRKVKKLLKDLTVELEISTEEIKVMKKLRQIATFNRRRIRLEYLMKKGGLA